MKHIVKGDEPLELAEWKALENENWKPTYEALSGEQKKATKRSLMEEQGYICCYCERRLEEYHSHIEHFNPQSANEVDPVEYGNMLCSCQNKTQSGEPLHCGMAKGDWFDEELLVSPFESKCEKRFEFTGDGRIMPASDQDAAAKETIRRLALNIRKLDALRANAIEPFLDETLSENEFSEFVTGHLSKDHDGKFGEFWTTIKQIFGEYRLS